MPHHEFTHLTLSIDGKTLIVGGGHPDDHRTTVPPEERNPGAQVFVAVVQDGEPKFRAVGPADVPRWTLHGPAQGIAAGKPTEAFGIEVQFTHRPPKPDEDRAVGGFQTLSWSQAVEVVQQKAPDSVADEPT